MVRPSRPWRCRLRHLLRLCRSSFVQIVDFASLPNDEFTMPLAVPLQLELYGDAVVREYWARRETATIGYDADGVPVMMPLPRLALRFIFKAADDGVIARTKFAPRYRHQIASRMGRKVPTRSELVWTKRASASEEVSLGNADVVAGLVAGGAKIWASDYPEASRWMDEAWRMVRGEVRIGGEAELSEEGMRALAFLAQVEAVASGFSWLSSFALAKRCFFDEAALAAEGDPETGDFEAPARPVWLARRSEFDRLLRFSEYADAKRQAMCRDEAFRNEDFYEAMLIFRQCFGEVYAHAPFGGMCGTLRQTLLLIEAYNVLALLDEFDEAFLKGEQEAASPRLRAILANMAPPFWRSGRTRWTRMSCSYAMKSIGSWRSSGLRDLKERGR